jgi:hypothetical protein
MAPLPTVRFLAGPASPTETIRRVAGQTQWPGGQWTGPIQSVLKPLLLTSISLFRRFAVLGQLDHAEVLAVFLCAQPPFEVGAEFD